MVKNDKKNGQTSGASGCGWQSLTLQETGWCRAGDGRYITLYWSAQLRGARGEGTVEKGYVWAGQIVNGQLEDAIGGGVSQLATTIYNAAFFGGLEIITHTPHQFYISRYPEGREATVSWGGPELIVRNDWPAAVLMKLSAGSAGVTVDFYSTGLGREVTTETLSRAAGRAPKIVEEKNPDLPPGTRTVLQSAGASGFTITYSRTVTIRGKTKRDETFTWRYSPQDAFVEVGPPKKPEPDEPTDGEDPGEDPNDDRPPPDEPEGNGDTPAAPVTPEEPALAPLEPSQPAS